MASLCLNSCQDFKAEWRAGTWTEIATTPDQAREHEHLLAAVAAKFIVLYQQLQLALELVVSGQDHRLPANIVPLSGSFSDRAVSQQAPAHSWKHWFRYQGL